MDSGIGWQKYSEKISGLEDLDYNFDAQLYHNAQEKLGWNIDRYENCIGKETPGAPQDGGIFLKAKEIIQFYKFPDPSLVVGIFDPQRDLDGRNMLIRASFLGLTFYFGVRVSAVIDQVQTNSRGNLEHQWGYSYRTLKGHFEVGEITFLVQKDTVTGEVFFKIESYSKADRIPNLFYRVGFKIFGRRLQKYFATSSIERIKEMVNS
ncbi:MAG: DUF1990 domain-containing protein [Bdellovibrionales bacterium]|nr:DUF1990 domain-containing protein [Bdellovibrionales bacterium]